MGQITVIVHSLLNLIPYTGPTGTQTLAARPSASQAVLHNHQILSSGIPETPTRASNPAVSPILPNTYNPSTHPEDGVTNAVDGQSSAGDAGYAGPSMIPETPMHTAKKVTCRSGIQRVGVRANFLYPANSPSNVELDVIPHHSFFHSLTTKKTKCLPPNALGSQRNSRQRQHRLGRLRHRSIEIG